jgi:hypothetical protein
VRLRLACREIFIDLHLVKAAGASHWILVCDQVPLCSKPSAKAECAKATRKREAAAVREIGEGDGDHADATEMWRQGKRVSVIADRDRYLSAASAAFDSGRRDQHLGRQIVVVEAIIVYNRHG